MLAAPEHHVERPRFPVIDAHNHAWKGVTAADFVVEMDRRDVRQSVILDAGHGEQFAEFMQSWVGAHKDRFLVFTNPDWNSLNARDFPEKSAALLEDTVRLGACGLKIPKGLGLRFRDSDGKLVPVDDRRFDLLWAKCGEVGVPVCIHTGDPAAFFEPLDGRNERWDELHAHPDWHFHGRDFPSLEQLLRQLRNVVRRHLRTTFIGAHVGGYAENLRWVGRFLDECPNFYVDVSERIPELGRQPYTARRFFIEYQDRILFGTDRPTPREDHVLTTWFRLLETDDEYFQYSPDPIPRQGRWRVYGLHLPDDVLRKIYHANAVRVIPGARA